LHKNQLLSFGEKPKRFEQRCHTHESGYPFCLNIYIKLLFYSGTMPNLTTNLDFSFGKGFDKKKTLTTAKCKEQSACKLFLKCKHAPATAKYRPYCRVFINLGVSKNPASRCRCIFIF
jgi:hypothetical protein